MTVRRYAIAVSVEGGTLSGDWTMPENFNRIVSDPITRNWCFTTGETANDTLCRRDVAIDRIFCVSDTKIDTLLKQFPCQLHLPNGNR